MTEPRGKRSDYNASWWTKDLIIEAMQGWAARHGGVAPTMREWRDPEMSNETNGRHIPKYVKERIVEEMQGWAARHGGAAPTMQEWREPETNNETIGGYMPRYVGRPTTNVVIAHFGRWNLAVEVAGLKPRKRGEREQIETE